MDWIEYLTPEDRFSINVKLSVKCGKDRGILALNLIL